MGSVAPRSNWMPPISCVLKHSLLFVLSASGKFPFSTIIMPTVSVATLLVLQMVTAAPIPKAAVGTNEARSAPA